MNRVEKSNKGPLVRVEIAPGRLAKMYEADAAAAGLLPEKRRTVPENKLRLPTANKSAVEVDDFTVIPGVGPAGAAELYAAGYVTLAELRRADLGGLKTTTRRAVEAWLEE